MANTVFYGYHVLMNYVDNRECHDKKNKKTTHVWIRFFPTLSTTLDGCLYNITTSSS